MKVVHCKKEKYDIYIGRGSKWGNPFVIGKDGNREEVIKKYEKYILKREDLLNDLHELKGKTLGCWCAPLPCHGDVLVKLANQETDSTFKEIKGNIWNVLFDYNVLCVTTNGVIRSDGEAVMGRGIAGQVKQKCPTIPRILANMINKNGNVVNRICTITNRIKETELYSFPTKHHWRNKSDIKLISRSAHQLVELADKHNWQKVLLPRPGCANGGLNWLDVKPILEKIFDNRFYIITL